MRRVDRTPIDPEIAAQLDAVDATLAGEPVDPRHADLAELALLLAADRPTPPAGFVRSMDERVARRFAPPQTAPRPAGPRAARGTAARPGRRRGWWMGSLAALSAAAVGVLVAVVVVNAGGGGAFNTGSNSVAGTASAPARAAAGAAGSTGGSESGGASSGVSTAASSAASSAAKPPAASSAAGAPAARAAVHPDARSLPAQASANGSLAPSPQPVPNGRKIVQSAQLALAAAPIHIDDVAQELYNVVGRENGYVNHSTVAAGAGGYAQFELSVPSAGLADTMTALSQLRYATVTSRTDSVQDVNGQYLSDQRRLADDRALRTSLLKQLAAATTQQEIDSLNARIHDAEASIRSDEAKLRSMNHAIDYSQVNVTVNPAAAPAPVHRSGSSFTLGRAAHDAGRVLTVAAGVALIALAVLVPVALAVALVWWLASTVQRRRREHALDLA